MVISSHPTRTDGTSAAIHSCRIYQQTSRHPLLAPPVTNGIQTISQSEAPDWLRDRFSLPHTPGCHRSRGYTGKDPGRNKRTTDDLLDPLYMTKLCAWEGPQTSQENTAANSRTPRGPNSLQGLAPGSLCSTTPVPTRDEVSLPRAIYVPPPTCRFTCTGFAQCYPCKFEAMLRALPEGMRVILLSR